MAIEASKPYSQWTMMASEFKAKCLKLMDEVVESGGEILITKHGRPVAKLTAFRERAKTFFVDDSQRISVRPWTAVKGPMWYGRRNLD